MTAVYVSLVGELCELFHQSRVHLIGCSFEETTAASQKESVTGENRFVVTLRCSYEIANVTLKLFLIISNLSETRESHRSCGKA